MKWRLGVVSQKWWSGGGSAAVSSPNFFSRGLGWCGWSIGGSKNFERSSSSHRPHHLAGWSGGGAAAVSSPNFFSRGLGWCGWGIEASKNFERSSSCRRPHHLGDHLKMSPTPTDERGAVQCRSSGVGLRAELGLREFANLQVSEGHGWPAADVRRDGTAQPRAAQPSGLTRDHPDCGRAEMKPHRACRCPPAP